LQERQYDLEKVIVVEALTDVPPVWATRQLELVFENLINNALAAMKNQLRGVLRFVTSGSSDGAWVEAAIAVQYIFPSIAPSIVCENGSAERYPCDHRRTSPCSFGVARRLDRHGFP